MAETPTQTYDSFCTECTALEATILALEAAPSLATIDELSAAQTRLSQVQQALPALCSASERYEAEQRYAALLAVQAPRWADAATAKVAALGDVATKLSDLFTSIDAFNTAHGTQMSVLMAMNYSREFRIKYSAAPYSLQQIIISMAQGDRSWLARVATFDAEGVLQELPFE